MNSDIKNLLEGVQNGSVSVEDALLKIKKQPFEDLGYAKVDLHRKARQGAAEVIYGAGKTPEQITGIVRSLQKADTNTILITRLDEEKAREIVPYLIETIAYSNPSGKNTTTGTNILPSVVMIEKNSVPYNLVNAFATPTDWKKRKERETGNGNVYDSVKWLADECDKMQKKYGIDSERYWFSCFDIDCDSAQTVESFKELLDKAAALV